MSLPETRKEVQHKAVFLDRDGTINVEVNYLSRVKDFKMLQGVPEAIRALRQHGYKIIVVTNQSGITRGFYSEADVAAIHARMAHELDEYGTQIDAIYYCPHAPGDGCDCRKPAAGLYVRAALDLNLDLATSFCVGDKLSDLTPAQRLGCRTVLVLTGHGAVEAGRVNAHTVQPDLITADLASASAWIMDQLEKP